MNNENIEEHRRGSERKIERGMSAWVNQLIRKVCCISSVRSLHFTYRKSRFQWLDTYYSMFVVVVVVDIIIIIIAAVFHIASILKTNERSSVHKLEWMFDLFEWGRFQSIPIVFYKYYIKCILLNWHFTYCAHTLSLPFFLHHFFWHFFYNLFIGLSFHSFVSFDYLSTKTR